MLYLYKQNFLHHNKPWPQPKRQVRNNTTSSVACIACWECPPAFRAAKCSEVDPGPLCAQSGCALLKVPSIQPPAQPDAQEVYTACMSWQASA
eukprot:1137807-Pelagomonas_calceolata.AAC.3